MTEAKNILTFKSGIPGLPEEFKEFKFIALQENSAFYLLQSVLDEEICFILVDPFIFFPGYEFKLPEEDRNKIELQDIKDVAVFCIVNASRGIKEATVNLCAPLVVNTAKRLARQIVLNDGGHNLRQPLPAAAAARGGTACAGVVQKERPDY
ncbi:MAG TPA: flagellar assembly protein FliW [Bacillota bacterium]|nr:flagellar assembly protein FliW [Bacillota bacterium]